MKLILLHIHSDIILIIFLIVNIYEITNYYLLLNDVYSYILPKKIQLYTKIHN